ncbi:efflux transporter outer membrane subunit [Catenovulum sp. 2E275]|uniref:efflux transporter outer membrane subunit n=1 Tax=Catenovulum sp. 2E275 TaxID=2980497 RepID=UPI0021D322DE|nr:efflux transporter outer membrane subunit [Catenovulum sp. 2E275]MCU4675801.1 efflux transporter outer membrane subunit [Catenovulum sp. 2E275]
MNFKQKIKLIAFSVCLSACQSNYQGNVQQKLEIPPSWQNSVPEVPNGTLMVQWLHSERLNQLIQQAMQHNQSIQIKRLDVEKAHLDLDRAGAVFWPELDFSLRATRSQEVNEVPSNQFQAGLSASYELDIWGKLTDAQKAAQYSYQNAVSQLKQAELELATSVSDIWLQMLAIYQQIELSKQKLKNVQGNLDIIENGYRAGLNTALDVYLTRNNLEDEKSNLTEQQANFAEQSRQLALLLGEYPKQDLWAGETFPEVDFKLLQGLPSELVMGRPDVQAAWLSVLMNNANLAIAHKNRFPSFQLTADVNDRQSNFSDLFSQGIAWSLAASLTQPIFDAGRLAALEKQAKIELSQAELSYLQTVYTALEEIETGLNQFKALESQLKSSLISSENAVLAEELAFEQYKRGLTDYSDYLSTQRTAFTAKNQVIEIKRKIINNQIALHQALGGDFAIEQRALATATQEN